MIRERLWSDPESVTFNHCKLTWVLTMQLEVIKTMLARNTVCGDQNGSTHVEYKWNPTEG